MLEKDKWEKNVAVTNILLFVILLLLVDILVLQTNRGFLLLLGTMLLCTTLLKPKFIYFLLISLFSIDGYSALPGASMGKIVGVVLAGGLILRLVISREAIPADSTYKYFFLFFAGSIPSFALSKDLSASLSIYFTYLSLFSLYFFTRFFLKSIEDIHDALDWIFFSTLGVFAITQLMNISLFDNGSSRISGGLADPNLYASYILVLLPLSFYRAMKVSKIRRIIYWASFLSFFSLVIFTGSRGGVLGFLGAAAVLVYYYSIRRIREIILAVVAVTAILLLTVPDTYWDRIATIRNPGAEKGASISIREGNYAAAMKMFADYPLAGVGLNNFRLNSYDYGALEGGRYVVHNTYLEILTGGGLLSFIPFSFVLINCWLKLKTDRYRGSDARDLVICLKASFMSLLITSFFFSGDHEKILWFLLALISSVYYIVCGRNMKSVVTLCIK